MHSAWQVAPDHLGGKSCAVADLTILIRLGGVLEGSQTARISNQSKTTGGSIAYLRAAVLAKQLLELPQRTPILSSSSLHSSASPFPFLRAGQPSHPLDVGPS